MSYAKYKHNIRDSEYLLRGCLHKPYREGWPYQARSRVLFEILIKNCLRLHEKRASPPIGEISLLFTRDLA
jgi:hypothetical protein